MHQQVCHQIGRILFQFSLDQKEDSALYCCGCEEQKQKTSDQLQGSIHAFRDHSKLKDSVNEPRLIVARRLAFIAHSVDRFPFQAGSRPRP